MLPDLIPTELQHSYCHTSLYRISEQWRAGLSVESLLMIELPQNSEAPATALAPFARDHRQDRLLRIRSVVARTGLSVATIYRREGEGSFPRRERIGLRCVAWYESDIDDFVADPLHYRTVPESRHEGSGKPFEMSSAQT